MTGKIVSDAFKLINKYKYNICHNYLDINIHTYTAALAHFTETNKQAQHTRIYFGIWKLHPAKHL